MRLRSADSGRTWIEEDENVPRLAWSRSFADGEFFEIDCYGFLDPRDKDTYWYYGAWSFPGDPAGKVRREFVKLRTNWTQPVSFRELQEGPCEPTHPWWQVLNIFEQGEERALAEETRLGHPPVPRAFDTGENIKIGGPCFTTGIEHEGRLLALGYWAPRGGRLSNCETFCFQSRDRGRTWEEFSVVARGNASTPEGFNEATLVRLKDGRLYSVLRSGNLLHHVWSSDGGRSWTPPEPMRLVDSDHLPQKVWPVCKVLEDGTLVLVYGRPGKHIIFDPSGTGTQWQGHVDLHARELAMQAANGVPPKLRLRGDTGGQGIRQWDSGDYLFLVPIGPREMLVGYDVQNYLEHAGAPPVSGVRMVRVKLENT
jgi:hypothetical protein